jgi:hypothetical protein
VGDEMTGNVGASRKPGAGLTAHMLQKLLEGADPSGSPDDPQVQAERHHHWPRLSLAVQLLETVDGVLEPV